MVEIEQLWTKFLVGMWSYGQHKGILLNRSCSWIRHNFSFGIVFVGEMVKSKGSQSKWKLGEEERNKIIYVGGRSWIKRMIDFMNHWLDSFLLSIYNNFYLYLAIISSSFYDECTIFIFIFLFLFYISLSSK